MDRIHRHLQMDVLPIDNLPNEILVTIFDYYLHTQIVTPNLESEKGGRRRSSFGIWKRLKMSAATTVSILRNLKKVKTCESERSPPREIYENSRDIPKVVLCLNYRQRRHAIFGPFKETYPEFKDEFLEETCWIEHTPRLAFGPGRVLMRNDRVGELKKSCGKSTTFLIEWSKEGCLRKIAIKIFHPFCTQH